MAHVLGLSLVCLEGLSQSNSHSGGACVRVLLARGATELALPPPYIGPATYSKGAVALTVHAATVGCNTVCLPSASELATNYVVVSISVGSSISIYFGKKIISDNA